MLSSENGFVNVSILRPLGKQEISWYTESKYWPAILIIIYIWKTFGYNCILYYATLVGIDRDVYKRQGLDGIGPGRGRLVFRSHIRPPRSITVAF